MKRTSVKRPDFSHCLRSPETGCGIMDLKRCLHCGFNRAEAERRRNAPWEKDAQGLWHKVIRKDDKKGDAE